MSDLDHVDLPAGWAWAELGEVATSVKNGIYISRPGIEPDGVPILRISAVRPMRLSIADLRYTGMTLDDVEAKDGIARPGDILFTRYNGNVNLVGAGARVPDGAPIVAYPDKLIRVRLSPEIDSRFVCFAWAWVHSTGRLKQYLKTTAGQVGISGNSLKGIRIPIAPQAEQRRIIEALEGHLSRLDDAVMTLRRCSIRTEHLWGSTLNNVARGTFLGNPISSEVAPICDVAQVSGGIQKQQKRIPIQNMYPFLRVANVARGRLNLTDIHKIELYDGELERHRLESGDLLVVEGNGSPDQIGRAASWHGAIKDTVHQNHLIRVRPGSRLLPRYLELIWNSALVTDQLREVARSTSGLYTLSTSKVKTVRIPVPSITDQRALVENADAWETYAASARASLQRADARSKSLRRAIISRAFSGGLVGQDPADEPASTILNRIRAERGASGGTARVAIRRPQKGVRTAVAPAAPSADSIRALTDAVQQELPL